MLIIEEDSLEEILMILERSEKIKIIIIKYIIILKNNILYIIFNQFFSK